MLQRRLLQEHQHQLEDEEIVGKFLSMLAFFALAIVQAVAFINANDISLSDYISHYKGSEKDATDLLSEEFEDQGRYRDTKNPVATAWYISFEQIRKHDDIAAGYLSFMAVTANSNIPVSMLPPSGSKVEQTKALGTLKSYAFITERQARGHEQQAQMQEQEKAYDVHPLVHLAMRSWLKVHNQWTPWVEKTVNRLIDIVPFGGYGARRIWIAYLPHAMHVVDLPEVDEENARMFLLERIAWCEKSLGRYRAAGGTFRQLLEHQQKVLGREHLRTLNCMHVLAQTISDQGKYADAEALIRETLALREKVLGKEHPETLASINGT